MGIKEDIEGCVPGLRRFARALVQRDPVEPQDVADELVEETLIRALRSERSARFVNTKLWLYATLCTLNRKRRRTKTATVPDHDPHEEMPLHAGVRAHGVSQALGSLPVEEREALLLVVLEDFTYAEAAEVLNIPRTAVAARIVRARRGLTESLDAALTIEARNRIRHPEYLRLVK